MKMKREESHNVEYKESWHDKHLEWVCGYANAKGETLYIGIGDGTKKPVGVKNPNKLLENISNSIRNLLYGFTDEQLVAAVDHSSYGVPKNGTKASATHHDTHHETYHDAKAVVC